MLRWEETVCLDFFQRTLLVFSLVFPSLGTFLQLPHFANAASMRGEKASEPPLFQLTAGGMLSLASELKGDSDCIDTRALKCNLALKPRM